ncbi:curli-like amyloid fiber formation chaperone CsgH [Methylobacterium sp. A54F]
MPIVDLPPADLTCRVVETRAGDTARIGLRIEGPAGVTGRYTIRVGKSDSAGSAQLSQAGAFPAMTGHGEPVGNVILGVGPETVLRIDGQIEVEGRTMTCRTEREDRL